MSEKRQELFNTLLSRRQFGQLALGMAGVTAVNMGTQVSRRPQEAGHWVGKHVIDTIRNPEALMPSDGMTILIPRGDATPKVEADDRSEQNQHVDAELIGVDSELVLRFVDTEGLRGKFSGEELAAQDFTCRGVAVLTSAEGLQHGKQEFCILTHAENAQAVAVGYESGTLYRYDNKLLEWEELVTDSDSQSTTIAINQSIWTQFLDETQLFQTGTLLHEVETGNQLLQALEYKPFPALRPDLQMPEMSQKISINSQRTAQSRSEVLNYTEEKVPFLITEAGMLLDIEHLSEKTAYVTSLWAQLSLIQKKRNSAHQQKMHDVSLFQGTTSDIAERFHFSVEDSVFDTYSLADIIQMIMYLYTTATEGIMQRDILVTARNFGVGKSRSTGMSPEDPYTNTVSTVITLELLQDINSELATSFQSNLDLLLEQEFSTPLEQALACDALYLQVAKQGQDIRHIILEWVLDNWGIQHFTGEYQDLAYGLYHCIGMQVGTSNNSIPDFQGKLPERVTGVQITHLPNFAVSIPTALKETKGGLRINKLRKMFSGK